MQNRAFWKTFNSLTHPITILSVILLLLNDHFLRIHFPSWWTGKLGDFAWLTFAPFICALIFAWIITRRLPNQVAWVGYVSFSFIGVWFTLAKTVPAAQDATNTALSALIGWQTSLRLDPTDLLTLPALYIGWWVWQHAPDTAPNLRPYGWLVVGVGIFATLATSPPNFEYGIDCIIYENGDLYVDSYFSDDGGLSWQEMGSGNQPSVRCLPENPFGDLTLGEFRLEHDGQLFRFLPGQSIDVSDDDGQTWTQEIDLSSLSHDSRRIYFERGFYNQYADPVRYRAGPFDAVIDEQTGNIVVAMGLDGVLVRTANAQWQWVRVGDTYYRPSVFADRSQMAKLLTPVVLGALTLMMIAAIVINVSIGFWLSDDKDGATPLFVLWLLWFYAGFPHETLFDSESILQLGHLFSNFYFRILAYAVLFIACEMIFSGLRRKEFHAPQDHPISRQSAFIAVIIGLFYLLPYVLWLNQSVYNYRFVWLFASIFGFVMTYIMRYQIRKTQTEISINNEIKTQNKPD